MVDCIYIIGHPEYEKDRIEYVKKNLIKHGLDEKKMKSSTELFYDRRRQMEWWRKDPRCYSKIDEGLWKDEEMFHCFILGSSKADGKISQKTKAITEKIGKPQRSNPKNEI